MPNIGPNGIELELTGVGGNTNIISLTHAAMSSLVSSNTVTPNTTYNIMDADSTLYGGTSIFIRSLTDNKLSAEGTGLFYNPKYEQFTVGNGVYYPYINYTVGTISDRITENTTVTNNLGGTGTYLARGFIKYLSGTWNGATSITGNSITENITVTHFPAYTTNSTVIWGGKKWINTGGSIGTSTDKNTLDSQWTVVPFDSTNYNLVSNSIVYDIENNIIVKRSDSLGNVIESDKTTRTYFTTQYGAISSNSIKDFQWGHTRVSNVKSTGSYLENINYTGGAFKDILQKSNCSLYNIVASNGSSIYNINQDYYSIISNITQFVSDFYNITQNNFSSVNGLTQSDSSFTRLEQNKGDVLTIVQRAGNILDIYQNNSQLNNIVQNIGFNNINLVYQDNSTMAQVTQGDGSKIERVRQYYSSIGGIAQTLVSDLTYLTQEEGSILSNLVQSDSDVYSLRLLSRSQFQNVNQSNNSKINYLAQSNLSQFMDIVQVNALLQNIIMDGGQFTNLTQSSSARNIYNLTIHNSLVYAVDINGSSTHIYNFIPKTITTRPDNVTRLRYLGNSDVDVIVPVTS